jgi:hypothetical protein
LKSRQICDRGFPLRNEWRPCDCESGIRKAGNTSAGNGLPRCCGDLVERMMVSGRGNVEDWASEGGEGGRNQQDAVCEYDYNASNTGVLYVTEDMLRRYSDPLPPMRMRSLKIDGSRRDDKIRFVSCRLLCVQSHSWAGEKD